MPEPMIVQATTFEPMPVKWDHLGIHYRDETVIGVALPSDFEDPAKVYVSVKVLEGIAMGNEATGPLIDRGPWNLNDPFWRTGDRPAVEKQFKEGLKAENGRIPLNTAGIDLSWGMCRALGLPKLWRGKVEMCVYEGGESSRGFFLVLMGGLAWMSG